MKRNVRGMLLVFAAVGVLLTGCGKDDVDKYAIRDKGIASLEAGNYGEAIATFDEAIQKSSGFVGKFEIDVLKYRAEAEYQNGDYEDAIESYSALIQVDGERAEYLYLRCSAYAGLDRLEEAVADYDKASELEGKNSEKSPGVDLALLSLGTAYENEGDYDKAMSLYNQAVAAGMQSGEVYNRMGLCKLDAGAYEEALSYFEMGRRTGDEESLPKLIYNQGVTYEYMGDYKNAFQCLSEYRDAYGGDDVTDKELAFLKTRVFGDAQQTAASGEETTEADEGTTAAGEGSTAAGESETQTQE